jgi:hypothetical protein
MKEALATDTLMETVEIEFWHSVRWMRNVAQT